MSILIYECVYESKYHPRGTSHGIQYHHCATTENELHNSLFNSEIWILRVLENFLFFSTFLIQYKPRLLQQWCSYNKERGTTEVNINGRTILSEWQQLQAAQVEGNQFQVLSSLKINTYYSKESWSYDHRGHGQELHLALSL